MSLEILSSRILAPYFGNSIFVWGSLISVFLAALSLGYYIGGRFADKKPSYTNLALILLISGLLILALPLVYPKINNAIFEYDFGVRSNPLIACLILFFIPSCFLGAVSPFVIRMAARSVETVGNVSGTVYSISTVGSILGTLFTAFYLIPVLGIRTIGFLIGGCLVITSFLTLFFNKTGKNKPKSACIISNLTLIIILFGSSYSFASPKAKIIYEKDSLYYHIIVMEDSCCRYLKFDFDMRHCQSAMYLNTPYRSRLTYPGYIPIFFAFNPAANDILVLGLGGGSMPKLLHKINPDLNIDAVELDPEVLKVAEKFFYFKDGVHANVYINDARIYAKKTDKKYDVVIIDVYKSDSPPYHLLTREYFEELSSILKEGGLLLFNLYDPYNREIHKPVIKTLRAVFNNTTLFDILPDADIIVAGNSKHKTTLESLSNGAEIVRKKYGFDLKKRIQTWKEVYIGKNIPIFTDDYSPGSLYRIGD